MGERGKEGRMEGRRGSWREMGGKREKKEERKRERMGGGKEGGRRMRDKWKGVRRDGG